MRKIFNKEQEGEIINLYLNKKIPGNKIAKTFNVHYSTVYDCLKRNNIEIRRKILSNNQIKEVIYLYIEKKLPLDSIAKMFKVSITCIVSCLNINNIKRRDGSVLTKEQLRIVKDLYLNKKKTTQEIANIFGVHCSTVSNNFNAKGIKILGTKFFNKGKRYSQKTEFKKGHKTWNSDKVRYKKWLKEHPDYIKNSRSIHLKLLRDNPEYLKKMLSFSKPNKVELFLNNLLQKEFPNQWKFVGNGDLIIGGKCPDFINVNGHREKIIELFGEYWHKDRKNIKVSYNRTKEGTIKHYKKFGFDTCVIWCKELKTPKLVIERIRAFSNGGII